MMLLTSRSSNDSVCRSVMLPVTSAAFMLLKGCKLAYVWPDLRPLRLSIKRFELIDGPVAGPEFL